MRKGFTLIELLAVIVILAIIALIATPIILGIINDAKEDSNKRSIENYAHAVELAVARYAAGNDGVIPFGEYEIKSGGKSIENGSATIEIDYKGEAITDGKVIVIEEEGKEGQIKISGISFDGNKFYDYSESGGVKKQEEKEISEEKDLGVAFYMYNAMYHETQVGLFSSLVDDVDDLDSLKISRINPELSEYIMIPEVNVPISEFPQAAPTSGDIKAVITHYDGREEEITLTTTDNKKWEYIIIPGEYLWGFYTGDILEVRPYTRQTNDPARFVSDSENHYISFGNNRVLFTKITILGKTIEFPVNKQAMFIPGNYATETYEHMYNDIDKVSKIIVNYTNGEKKEYKRSEMYPADDYIGDGNDFYSSSSIPVLYTTEETRTDFDGIKTFVINIPEIDVEAPIESIIVEEDGVLIKYNISNKTNIEHGMQGS